MTHVFYAVSAGSAEPGHLLILDGDEGHHAVKVRRIETGEQIEIIDGLGARAAGTVQSVSKQACVMLVESIEHDAEVVPPLTVIQALTKKDRADQVIELLTEVGVDTIIPWRAQRSVMKEVPAKWARIVVESCKQSRQARFPDVHEVTETAQIVQGVRDQVTLGVQVLICHERATAPIAEVVLADATGYVIVIGPEGGLTDDEISALVDAGGQLVLMGPSVLRAATAGAVAASIVSAVSGRWVARG